MAPLVGLEPTTCGLTEHETPHKKARQAIKKQEWCSVFGDHPATEAQKQPFAKMVSPPVSVPVLPFFPGRFLLAGMLIGKFRYSNC